MKKRVTKENLFTRDLIFDAVPYSSANIFAIRGIWSLGGITKEIILVPFLKWRENKKQVTQIPHPRAAVRLLINFLTFHISTWRSCAAESESPISDSMEWHLNLQTSEQNLLQKKEIWKSRKLVFCKNHVFYKRFSIASKFIFIKPKHQRCHPKWTRYRFSEMMSWMFCFFIDWSGNTPTGKTWRQ